MLLEEVWTDDNCRANQLSVNNFNHSGFGDPHGSQFLVRGYIALHSVESLNAPDKKHPQQSEFVDCRLMLCDFRVDGT